MTQSLAPIEEAIKAISKGEIVVLVDDEDRENEGDLVVAAQYATPDTIAFFLAHTSGFICVAMLPERLDELNIPLMVQENTESQKTAFTVTVDAKLGNSTGISAEDRARTIAALINPDILPADLARPGHILPLRYRNGGVLKRAGHTEASVDLCRAAGLYPAGVICEVVSKDRKSMARLDELKVFAKEHNLVLSSIADLVRYRSKTDKLVKKVSQATIPTKYGDFICIAYESILDGETHIVLQKGEINPEKPVLVRVHSECLTGDIFGSKRCDCGPQLAKALELISENGSGVVVYLRGHEGRGIGIAHKLRAYTLQENGRDTVEANLDLGLPVDSREYGIGAQILVDLGINKMQLMTNNPSKYGGLEGFGLEITGRVPLMVAPTKENIAYLKTKREKMGHLLDGLEDV